jgi:chromosome segregation ATPase
MKQIETAVNPEDALRKLREKTDKDELMELKRGLFGRYRNRDVVQYVARLKEQLQTVEKTYKGHIAEIVQEKDAFRAERDSLLGRLCLYESAAKETQGAENSPTGGCTEMSAHASMLASELQQAKHAAKEILEDKGSLEEKLAELAALADENIAGLQCKIEALETELKQALDDNAALELVKGALQQQLTVLTDEHEKVLETMLGQIKGLEEQLSAAEAAYADLESNLEDTVRKLDKKTEEGLLIRSQLSDTRQENCRLNVQVEAQSRENESLTAQVEVAKQNILKLLADKESAEALNAQLREALNSLVVKADAVIKENSVLLVQLESERDRVQQHQAMHDLLVDMVTRVRMANQLLSERLADMDKSLSWSSGQLSKPLTGAQRRNTKAELLDFTDGKSAALHDIITELNSIQTNLAQYQQPAAARNEPDKKPNIRYSVEKLEVDCAANKPEGKAALEEFRLPANREFGIKGR